MTLHFDPDAKRHSPEALSFFAKGLSEISDGWETLYRRMPFDSALTFTPLGLRLGAGTLIAKSVHGAERRILALLRIAFDGTLPERVIETLKAAEFEFKRGELAKAAMLVALSKIPAQLGVAGARRLHICKSLLDAQLMSLAGAEKLVLYPAASDEETAKFSIDQPRIPGGSEGGGQWTADSGIQTASSRESLRSDQSVSGLRGCAKEWREARADCIDLLSSANPARGLTGGYDNVEDCARGFVSERCVGNKVTV